MDASSCTSVASASQNTSTSNALEESQGLSVFSPEQCLFCANNSADFNANILHMQKVHSFFIPDQEHLVIECETLVEYLNLVIFGYNECICCGTQRNSPLAVQQHMAGKGHCRINIADSDSEYAGFYELSEAGSEDGGSDSEDVKTSKKTVQPDENTLRLYTGKMVSTRSSSQPHASRQNRRRHSPPNPCQLEADLPLDASSHPPTSTSLVSSPGRGPTCLTKSEKREDAFAIKLAKISDKDRTSLAHLPPPQQRAILATQQRQVEKARRQERRYQSRVERLGNKTLMRHFVPDTPGRWNG